MTVRDHDSVELEDFKGLFSRDPLNAGIDSCPQDHFSEAVNLDYYGDNVGIRQRFALLLSAGVFDVTRIFPFKNSTKNQYLLADKNGDLWVYDVLANTTTSLLVASSVTDYDFTMWGERCYIAPSIDGYYGDTTGVTIPGLYSWDGTTLRAAGGAQPGSPAAAANSGTAGVVQLGYHFYAIAYETITGFITFPTAATPGTGLLATGVEKVSFTGIPTGPTGTVARWIIASKTIATPIPGAGISDYQSFFLTRIGDNTTTAIDVNYYDSQLLLDSSYLFDIYSAIVPGGSSICTYHNRLVITAPNVAGVFTAIVSRVNDPETFDQVNGVVQSDVTAGLVVSVLTGITDAHALRDVLYLCHSYSTYSANDNGQEPAAWPVITVDSSFGSLRHGIAVGSKGGESVDYLMIANTSGLFLFTGFFNRPEISWKIETVWRAMIMLFRTDTRVTILNDPVSKKIYFIKNTPSVDFVFLSCNYESVPSDFSGYSQGVKWGTWETVTSIPANSFRAFCIETIAANTGTGVRLLGVGGSLGDIYLYGGSDSTVESLSASLRTFEVRDPANEMILHCGLVRFKMANLDAASALATGSITLYGVTTGLSKTLTNINIKTNSGIEPSVITNFMAQRISMRITFTLGVLPNLNLQKIIFFVKQMYRALPYQANQ